MQYKMSSPVKVLIVDDHPLTHSGLRLLFSQHQDFDVVGGFDRCDTTLSFVQTQPIDLILLDLNMPDGHGINVLAEIVKTTDICVVILTGENQFGVISNALNSGARGVVGKGDPPAEIILACQKALGGEVYISTTMREGLSKLEQMPISLSSRQMTVLNYLAAGISCKGISYRMSIPQATVAIHIEELRRKLNVPNNLQIVERAREKSLI